MKHPSARQGTVVQILDRTVEFSRWAMSKKGQRRWALSHRMFATDPWPIIRQAVQRSNIAKDAREAATAFVLQGQAYYVGAREAALAQAKPVLLYYSFLNVAKALILARGVEPKLDKVVHGLSEQLVPNGTELVDAYLDAYPTTAKDKNVFDLFWKALGGTGVAGTPKLRLDLPKLLPQVVPGHRLWSEGSAERERFIEIASIPLLENKPKKELWSRVQLASKDLRRFNITQAAALAESGLSPGWRNVKASSGEVWFEQVQPTPYSDRASDEVMTIIEQLAPSVWMTVLDNPPYRKHYLYLCPAAEVVNRLPQLCSIYAIAYYLGSITRYRPHHFQRILDTSYGPVIEAFLNDQPAQFLFLIASEIAKREVTRAALA